MSQSEICTSLFGGGFEVLFGALILVFVLGSAHLDGGMSDVGVVRIKKAYCFLNHVAGLVVILG